MEWGKQKRGRVNRNGLGQVEIPMRISDLIYTVNWGNSDKNIVFFHRYWCIKLFVGVFVTIYYFSSINERLIYTRIMN